MTGGNEALSLGKHGELYRELPICSCSALQRCTLQTQGEPSEVLQSSVFTTSFCLMKPSPLYLPRLWFLSPHLGEIARLYSGTTPFAAVWKLPASRDQNNRIMHLVCFLPPRDQNAVRSMIPAERDHCPDSCPCLAERGRSAIPAVMAPREQRQTVRPLRILFALSPSPLTLCYSNFTHCAPCFYLL